MTSTTTSETLEPLGDPGASDRSRFARFGHFLRRNWKLVVPATALAVAGLAWLAFGYFGVHTLFIDDKVDEDGPVFASGAVAGADADGSAAPPADDAAAVTDTDTTTDPGPDAAPPTESVTSGESPADTAGGAGSDEAGTGAPETDDPAEVTATDDPVDTAPPTEATAEPTVEATPEIVTLVEGTFIPRDHPGEGRAFVLNDGTEQRFLRFEDFATDNGPDLNVYLTASPADGPEGAFDDDFIDLGDLKGNIGPQNYEIPPDVDLDRYSTVVVWCVRFASAFTAADLAPPA